MGRTGFAFSLDAFVAFSLVLIAIQSLIVISSAPQGYYQGLGQANYLAQGTLDVVSDIRLDDGRTSLLDGVARNALIGSSPPDQLRVATERLIPSPYSYSYDYYDFGAKSWYKVYNASEHMKIPFDAYYNPRYSNVSFNRVMATSTILVGAYSDPVIVGDSPYCNVQCKGYRASTDDYSDPQSCIQVPCNVNPKSTFDAGDYSIGLLRLSVWG